MAENFNIPQCTKEQKYAELYEQISGVVCGETDQIANMANVSAMIQSTFDFWWTGFYRVIVDEKNVEQLVLGPFQGPIACTRIAYNRGVCGTAWAEKKTIIVPDVDKFVGHIACSSESKSEIVVPIIKADKVVAVLDIDSEKLNTFDAIDQQWLEKIVALF